MWHFNRWVAEWNPKLFFCPSVQNDQRRNSLFLVVLLRMRDAWSQIRKLFMKWKLQYVKHNTLTRAHNCCYMENRHTDWTPMVLAKNNNINNLYRGKRSKRCEAWKKRFEWICKDSNRQTTNKLSTYIHTTYTFICIMQAWPCRQGDRNNLLSANRTVPWGYMKIFLLFLNPFFLLSSLFGVSLYLLAFRCCCFLFVEKCTTSIWSYSTCVLHLCSIPCCPHRICRWFFFCFFFASHHICLYVAFYFLQINSQLVWLGEEELADREGWERAVVLLIFIFTIFATILVFSYPHPLHIVCLPLSISFLPFTIHNIMRYPGGGSAIFLD